MHIVPCKFPFQTRDLIEKYHHKEILINFPQYAEFWSKFIGVKEANINNILSSYDLISVGSVSPNLPSFQKIHQEICMSHYSVFCNLATAHFNLTELSNLDSSDRDTYYFAHWRLFESAYMHLGAAWQEIKRIWDLLLVEFDQYPTPLPPKKSANEIFKIINKSSLKKRYNIHVEPIINFRDIIAHYFRVPSHYDEVQGKTFVPEKVNKQLLWSDLRSFSGSMIETGKKLKNDITTFESFINSTHVLLIGEFERVLKKHSLMIDYSSGKSDVVCIYCKWYKEEIKIPSKTDTDISSSALTRAATPVSGNVAPIASTTTIPKTTEYSSTESCFVPKIFKCRNPECGKEE